MKHLFFTLTFISQIIGLFQPIFADELIQTGHYDTPGLATDVYVIGDYAFLADGASGLQVINVSDPTNPTLAGNYDTSGSAQGIYVTGGYAYVADYSSGLQVINVSDPANPNLTGNYDTAGAVYAYDVYVSGGYAYLAIDWDLDLFSYMWVINVSNPAHPTLASDYTLYGDARALYVTGGYAYMACNHAGLLLININNPGNPITAGNFDTTGYTQGVYVANGYAYLAGGTSGLQVIDASDPSNPDLIGSYDTFDYAKDVYISDNYAYVADSADGLQVINVSDPSNPTLAGNYDTSGSAQGIYVTDGYAYVADGLNGLLVFKIESDNGGDGVTRYWGTFVGISDYQTISDLSFCADDATSMYDLFLQDSRWDASRMTLLLNMEASRSAIENAITTMASNSDDDDICLFFFSGHGGQADEDFAPFDESDHMDEYLVCWDSNISNYTGDFIDDDMGVTLGQISGTTVVMLDACYSGGHVKAADNKAASEKVQTSRNIKFIKKPFEQHAGITEKGDGFASDLVGRITTLKDANDQSDIIVLTASDDDETSSESFEFQHGEFTYFLLLGLKSNDTNSNGDVSAEESFAYLEPALTEYRNLTVTPQIYDSTSGETDLFKPTAERLVFLGYGNFEWFYPFNTNYQKRRSEYIYTQSQLGQKGYIKALKIFISEKPLMSLNNCTIRMKHTTDNEYGSSPQWASSGWTTVYSETKSIDNIGAVPFVLSTPFHYDGIRNLIIDFSFSNPNWENKGLFYGSFSNRYAMIYHYRDDDNYGEPTTWAGISPLPIRDENPPDHAGSYLDLEIEFYTIETSQGNDAMPWIPLLLLSE